MGISNYTLTDIIIGCSSGNLTNAAVSIIRISGLFCLEKFQPFFSTPLNDVVPRRMYLSRIVAHNVVLDELLFCLFTAPDSYNGETILELYPHGNALNVQRIIDAFIEGFALRSAYPGEFTFRAFKNKKLNLAQVEGLELLLNSNSQFTFNQGLQALHGDLFRSYRHLYDEYLSVKSAINLLIDFSEDVGEAEARTLLSNAISNFHKIISELYSRTQIQASSALAPRILLFGPTNAGKSSFFNYLLSEDRSIVSSLAGTTRDFVSEQILIDGNLFILTDSAGMRDIPENQIEEEGIRRTQALYTSSFFRVLILSAIEISTLDSKPHDYDLLVITHCDLPHDRHKLLHIFRSTKMPAFFIGNRKISSGPIEPPIASIGPMGPQQINYFLQGYFNLESGPMGPETSNFVCVFNRLVAEKYRFLTSQNPILIERHKILISRMFNTVSQANLLCDQSDLGVVSCKINEIGLIANDLIGIVTPDDSLDLVFSKFCIGK